MLLTDFLGLNLLNVCLWDLACLLVEVDLHKLAKCHHGRASLREKKIYLTKTFRWPVHSYTHWCMKLPPDARTHSFNRSLQHKYAISNNIFGTSQPCSNTLRKHSQHAYSQTHTHKGRSLSMNPILLHGSSISLWLLVYTEQLREEKLKVVKKNECALFPFLSKR